MRDGKAEELARMMSATRADTLRIFDLASEADLHQSPGFGFRPIIWHLAHIGVFEAYWILQRLMNEPAPDERYERIFDPINTPREESKDLPSRQEMEDYLKRVRQRVMLHLEQARFDDSNPLLRDAYIFRLVLEHEQQHQETLAYLFQMIGPEKKTRPSMNNAPQTLLSNARAASDAQPRMTQEMVSIPAGPFLMGAPWEKFVYDNELPAHAFEVPAFKLDRLLTTNEEYARFIAEGGYERREWWSAEGWNWRLKENWTCPLYWTREDQNWRIRTMFDDGLMQPQHPVTGVSWYEAEAYARFMKKRLPTEAEWEKAASWDNAREHKRCYAWGDEPPSSTLCNFDYQFWGTTAVGSFPQGASAYGCMDMTGNVWEWTDTAFAGYTGFKAFPYAEYSEIWFDGDHRILKGGSWATRASVLRTSFRNFFRRQFRIGFAGIRCAADG